MIVARVLQKGQIVIPKEIRDKVNLRRGDKVEVRVIPEGIVIQPLRALPSLTERFQGRVRGRLSLDDLEILHGRKH